VRGRFPRARVPGMLAAALLLAGAAPAAAGVRAEDAWIAETPPGAEVAAGYLVFTNDGDDAVKVVGAESPRCERVEMHTMDLSGGVARMRRQQSLSVPAGGRLRLEPGGSHLMLIRPESLVKGGTVPITFELSTGAKLSVDAIVRKPGEHGAHERPHEGAKPGT